MPYNSPKTDIVPTFQWVFPGVFWGVSTAADARLAAHACPPGSVAYCHSIWTSRLSKRYLASGTKQRCTRIDPPPRRQTSLGQKYELYSILELVTDASGCMVVEDDFWSGLIEYPRWHRGSMHHLKTSKNAEISLGIFLIKDLNLKTI